MSIDKSLRMLFSIEDHVALDRNLASGYNNLLLQLILGDLKGACPNKEFHTVPSLWHNQILLPNSYPKACMPSREAVCTTFTMIYGIFRLVHEPHEKLTC